MDNIRYNKTKKKMLDTNFISLPPLKINVDIALTDNDNTTLSNDSMPESILSPSGAVPKIKKLVKDDTKLTMVESYDTDSGKQLLKNIQSLESALHAQVSNELLYKNERNGPEQNNFGGQTTYMPFNIDCLSQKSPSKLANNQMSDPDLLLPNLPGIS